MNNNEPKTAEEIVAFQNALIKNLELELGKVISERDEAQYNNELLKRQLDDLMQRSPGELKELRRISFIQELESKNKKLRKDCDEWRNKYIRQLTLITINQK